MSIIEKAKVHDDGTISFDIVGLPAPQGSKTRMPNGAIVEGKGTEQRKRHRDWRTTVAQVARDLADDLVAPYDGPLQLHVTFRFPMTGSARKAERERGVRWKPTAPDQSKLLRALEDGLVQGGLVHDDARFVYQVVEKIETTRWTGASVRVGPMTTEAAA